MSIITLINDGQIAVSAMAYMASHFCEKPYFSILEIARNISKLPINIKILKFQLDLLCKSDMLRSRGNQYTLSREPESITIADIILAISKKAEKSPMYWLSPNEKSPIAWNFVECSILESLRCINLLNVSEFCNLFENISLVTTSES